MGASVTWLPSASRTTTQTSPDLSNQGCAYLDVILDMTVSTASPSVTLTINGRDPASGKYFLLLSGAAVTTNTTNRYRVGPGLTAAGNLTANDVCTETFQIVVTAGNANAGTYSVGYALSQ